MEINLKENLLMIKNMKVMDLFIMIIKIFMKEKLKKDYLIEVVIKEIHVLNQLLVI